MPNRAHRRAAARANPSQKQTHKLPTQRCLLWLPASGGYLLRVDPIAHTFTTVEQPAEAWHLDEDEAEAVCLVFRDLTGLPATVRPYFASSQG
ncbi:MAG: hypothetical protein EPO01_08680 [Aquabacterium sp.]|nr:MAG: hypothetical protein EPO01_08680 [Aquabacterium sp.]